MYPNLLNTNNDSKNLLEVNLSHEAFSLISSSEKQYKIKFKIIELFNIY